MRHIPAEVLERVESSSRAGVFYEIRKSHYDGKTYCTCPAWIFKARKGNGICKHLAVYLEALKSSGKEAKIEIYTADEFAKVVQILRENPDLTTLKKVRGPVRIDREF